MSQEQKPGSASAPSTPAKTRTLAAWLWCEARPRRALALICLLFFLPGFFTLPPLDRDEARFAQATKQMLETSQFVEIRFQDEARNKKPVGIYWLQALPASLLSGPDHNIIAAYRVPSFLAAVLAVFLTHALGTLLFDRRTGFVAAALLATSTLLVVEAGIAKTDAALLAATMAGLWALAKIYMAAKRGQPRPGRLIAAAFWAALGAGLLIKGPVVVMTLGLAFLGLGAQERSFAWAKGLRPFTGLLLMGLIAVPWYVAIYFATDGAFFAEALGKDFGSKIASGQESHGAPPGLYLALVWLTFWPASLYLIPSAVWAFGERAKAPFRFLLAWSVPGWIAIELIPTKLPHYALPLYPALALIVGAALVSAVANRGALPFFRTWPGKIGLLLWVVPGSVLLAAISLLPMAYGARLEPMLVASSLVGLILFIGVITFHLRGQFMRASLFASFAGLFVFAFLFEGTMARLDDLKLSPRLHHALVANGFVDDAQIGIIGYSEPSFIFLNGTQTALLSVPKAPDFLARGGRVLVVDGRKEKALRDALADLPYALEAVETIEGVNYSKGRDMVMTIFKVTVRPGEVGS